MRRRRRESSLRVVASSTYPHRTRALRNCPSRINQVRYFPKKLIRSRLSNLLSFAVLFMQVVSCDCERRGGWGHLPALNDTLSASNYTDTPTRRSKLFDALRAFNKLSKKKIPLLKRAGQFRKILGLINKKREFGLKSNIKQARREGGRVQYALTPRSQ